MTDARLRGEWLYVRPWVALTNDGRAVLACVLMWCAQQETDGFIPNEVLATLPGCREAAIGELADAGILHRLTDDGWQFADWAATQTTKAQHEQRRTAGRERLAKHRKKPPGDGVTNGASNGVTNGASNAELRGRQVGRKGSLTGRNHAGTVRVSNESESCPWCHEPLGPSDGETHAACELAWARSFDVEDAQ